MVGTCKLPVTQVVAAHYLLVVPRQDCAILPVVVESRDGQLLMTVSLRASIKLQVAPRWAKVIFGVNMKAQHTASDLAGGGKSIRYLGR